MRNLPIRKYVPGLVIAGSVVVVAVASGGCSAVNDAVSSVEQASSGCDERVSRQPEKVAKPASPYIASVKLSDFKMSAAENFIGHTVSYIDGNVTNSSNKTVTHVVVEVTFKDEMGQVAQQEPEMPLQVIRTNGAYLEPVDLSVSPLAPGVTQPFRLTFDSISAQWNRNYPEMRVTDVTVK